mmetsp:Transcript_28733/g.82543  ORF Transcript_28733/g.82543 Transcript_28733/m.82543 type:complete len:297 (-) Transcript_28733:204-1094(-)
MARESHRSRPRDVSVAAQSAAPSRSRNRHRDIAPAAAREDRGRSDAAAANVAAEPPLAVCPSPTLATTLLAGIARVLRGVCESGCSLPLSFKRRGGGRPALVATESPIASNDTADGAEGLDAAAIALLTSEHVCRGERGQCVVCQQAFQAGETLRLLPCGHEYHCTCVDQWLRINRSCPVCKRDVLTTTTPSLLSRMHSGRRRRAVRALNAALETAAWQLKASAIPPGALTMPIIGVAVQRGGDWKWGAQDGGTWQSLGMTVPGCEQEGWVRVLWHTGASNNYRVGAQGCFDLRRC